jgi:RNA polymerase sigma-70 factor (ECF subfamily)
MYGAVLSSVQREDTSTHETRLFGFDSFYRRNYQSVAAIAYALSGDRAAAEELAQDAFLAAFLKWDRVVTMERPDSWVKRVVANKAASRLRRIETELRALARLRPRQNPQGIPDDVVIAWDMVRRLPRRQAQAIALRYIGDLPVEEIALAIGCAPETVRTHLRRARKRLATSKELK